MPRAAACQDLEQRVWVLLQFLAFLASQLLFNLRLLLSAQKPGFVRPTRQGKVGEHTTDYGRRPLQNQQPPPTADAQPVHVIQDENRDWSTQDGGNRIGHD